MTDCSDWLNDLTYSAEVVLDEDLASLEKMPEEMRIDRYSEIKSNEQELLWEFNKECSGFITDSERDHLRGQLRLARLLLAASLYEGGSLPDELKGDFITAELEAVLEFDEYKQFDVLDEDQIEQRIRRMEGEVYELVSEYTSTQIANMDELIDNPDVQQDVIEKLVNRYDERREKVRQGFFVYVETHGLEHMVQAIEEAVTAVSDAATERERVRGEMENELSVTTNEVESTFQPQHQQVQEEILELERQIASGSIDSDEFSTRVTQIRERRQEMTKAESETIETLRTQINHASELEKRLEQKITELKQVKQQASNANRTAAQEDATELIENELDNLDDERSSILAEMERLETECEQIEQTGTRLDERQSEFESRLEGLDSTDESIEPGLEGDRLVTATIARLLELDYLGRFDTAMHELSTLQTPDGSFDVPDGYWNGRSQRSNNRPEVRNRLSDGDDPSRYPTNQAAQYRVTDSQYFGLSSNTRMVIEAMVFAHLDSYTSNGFDTQPADLDDLLALVNDAVATAEGGNHTYVLAIASPTGWTDRVRRQIAADDVARTHYSRQVSICLIDLQTGELIYDESDPLLAENADIFEPAIDAERTTACVSTIRNQYVSNVTCDSVLVSELIEDHGFDSHVVKRAFNQLADEGVGEQLYVEDVGLALYLD